MAQGDQGIEDGIAVDSEKGCEVKKKQDMKNPWKRIPVIRYDKKGRLVLNLASEADWLQKRRKTAKKKGE